MSPTTSGSTSGSVPAPTDEARHERQRAEKNELRRARERMRYVDPGNCGKILAHHRYWTPQFLRLYLERCHLTSPDHPGDAYLLAQHAPEVARRIRVGGEAAEYRSMQEKASHVVLALAVKGSCCRARDELEEAELCFRRARQIAATHQVEPRVLAELERRHAVIVAFDGDLERAGRMIEQSLELCRAHGYRAGEADALALRGYLRQPAEPGAAIVDHLESSRLADAKTARGRLTAQAAMQNIPVAVASGTVSIRDQETALKFLQQLKEDLKGTPLSLRKMKVLWIEGLILGNLGIDRHAERQLAKARHGMAQLDQASDYGLVSLDLVKILVTHGEQAAASRIAEETCSVLRAMDPDPRLVRAVCRWSAVKIDLETIRELRGRIQTLEA